MAKNLLILALLIQGLFTNLNLNAVGVPQPPPPPKQPIPTNPAKIVLQELPIASVVPRGSNVLMKIGVHTSNQNVPFAGTITMSLDVLSGGTTFEQEGTWEDVENIQILDGSGSLIAHGDLILPVAGQVMARIVFVCKGNYVLERGKSVLTVTGIINSRFHHNQFIALTLSPDGFSNLPGTWDWSENAKITVSPKNKKGYLRSVVQVNAPETVHPEIRLGWDQDTTFVDGQLIPVYWETKNTPKNAAVRLDMRGIIDGKESWGYTLTTINATNNHTVVLARVLRGSGEQYVIRASIFDENTDPHHYTALAQSDSPVITLNLPAAFVRSLYVTSPEAGINLVQGMTEQIRWTSSGIEPNGTIQIGIRPTDRNSEIGSDPIATTVDGGSFQWTIPNTLAPGTYRIEVDYVTEYGFFGAVATSADFIVTSAQGFSFTRDLQFGNTGNDVMVLQRILNSFPYSVVATQGPGSSGNEGTFFGSLTKAGLVKFQAWMGLASTGILDLNTRKTLNSMDLSGFLEKSPFTPVNIQVTKKNNGSFGVIRIDYQIRVDAGETDIEVPVASGVPAFAASVNGAENDLEGSELIYSSMMFSYLALNGDMIQEKTTVVKAGTSKTFYASLLVLDVTKSRKILNGSYGFRVKSIPLLEKGVTKKIALPVLDGWKTTTQLPVH